MNHFLPLHERIDITEEGASEGAATRIGPHRHHLGSVLLIQAIAGRGDDVLLEELLDVVIGALEGALSLIQELLHDIR